jgi:radical SAM protein with 4Fe4S-binding SPASM domain
VSDISKKRETAEKNLEKLAKVSKVYGSVTIDGPDFDSKYLIELIKKNKIALVRLGIANNTVENTGKGTFEDYKEIIQKIFFVARELKEKADVSMITLSCGLTPCMLSEEQKGEISSGELKLRGWGCAGKASHFDITAESGVLPCFYASGIGEKKLTDFKNLESAGKFSKDLLRHLITSLPADTIEKCHKCSYFRALKCGGPCLGYIVNNSSNKKELDYFRKSFAFRIIKKILFIGKNG